MPGFISHHWLRHFSKSNIRYILKYWSLILMFVTWLYWYKNLGIHIREEEMIPLWRQSASVRFNNPFIVGCWVSSKVTSKKKTTKNKQSAWASLICLYICHIPKKQFIKVRLVEEMNLSFAVCSFNNLITYSVCQGSQNDFHTSMAKSCFNWRKEKNKSLNECL